METDTETREQQLARIHALIESLGLSARFDFVPVSQSRNAERLWKPAKDAAFQKWQPTLNWRVTVTHKDRDLFTTDYSAGCAHAPSYNARAFGGTRTLEEQERNRAVVGECETGKAWRKTGLGWNATAKPIASPDIADLFYSLAMDSDAVDYPFEDWAANFGYDTDSRSAEATYRACLDIAIKLRSAIGNGGLMSLRTAFQDY